MALLRTSPKIGDEAFAPNDRRGVGVLRNGTQQGHAGTKEVAVTDRYGGATLLVEAPAAAKEEAVC